MANQSLNRVLQQLRKMAAVQIDRDLSDRELLDRFVGSHDESAFTVLIERHGPMALGVCRRALPNFHDAEDACQATFLVLARKAAVVRKKTSLGSWLHGVACRVAANLKRDHARRKTRERRIDAPVPKDPAAEVTWREAQTIVDEELQQLPERYRTPLILCYLECMTRDQAAQQMGLSSGSLHGRLERARDMLRARLVKRGLTLAAVMSATTLGESMAQAALAPTFVVSSTRAAVLFATGQPLAQCAVANHVLALTQEVLKTMFLAKLKLGTAAVLSVGLVMALVGGSFTSLGFAQDGKFYPPAKALVVRPTKTESDLDFIRRVSVDLRGADPTPTEIHFFVSSKDAGRRQKLIDLFIQERQAKREAETDTVEKRKRLEMEVKRLEMAHASAIKDIVNCRACHVERAYHQESNAALIVRLLETRKGDAANLVRLPIGADGRWIAPADAGMGLGALQKDFFKELHAAKEKGDVAKITQAYLDDEKQDAKKDSRFPDGRDHNFGKVKHGMSLKHTFRIVNTSDTPLRLTSVRVSSGCMTGSVCNKVLQPNEEGKVEVTVDTRRFVGSKTTLLFLEVEQRGITETFRFSTRANSVDQTDFEQLQGEGVAPPPAVNPKADEGRKLTDMAAFYERTGHAKVAAFYRQLAEKD